MIVDGLSTQRLDRPYVRENGKLRPATWQEAFAAIAAKVKRRRPTASAPSSAISRRAEEIYRAEGFDRKPGQQSSSIAARTARKLDPKFGRASYIFNPTIAGIDEADAIMIIGSNPRKKRRFSMPASANAGSRAICLSA